MDKPEVSVVMSAYNGADHLRVSMESVLSQAGVDLEFIIVDDGSTDESDKILSEYALCDSRVRILTQENKGLTRSLIRACSEARGKYIARQDVGDTSLPNRLALQRDAFTADENLVFVSCWTECVGPGLEPLFTRKGTGKASIPVNILSELDPKGVIDGPTSHATVMMRRSAYLQAGGYRKAFYYAQDWDLWYRLAVIGKLQVLPIALYRGAFIGSGISAFFRKEQIALSALALECHHSRMKQIPEDLVLQRAAAFSQGAKSRRIFPRHRALVSYFIGSCLLSNGDVRAESYLRQALRLNPFSWKAWARWIQCKTMIAGRSQDAT